MKREGVVFIEGWNIADDPLSAPFVSNAAPH
jgi:hypothetical protein